MKSLKEFNDYYDYQMYVYEMEWENEVNKSSIASVISSIIFYSVIIAMVFTAFLYSQRSSTGNHIFGYSYYNILTTSMNSEIPQGSFILVKNVDGETLQVGDDITYFESEDKVITHRIVKIYEDYEDSGQRGFETQGVDNPYPDDYITYEANIIGKVVWHMPYLGFILQMIAEHVVIVIAVFTILILIAFFLKIFFTPDLPELYEEEQEAIKE